MSQQHSRSIRFNSIFSSISLLITRLCVCMQEKIGVPVCVINKMMVIKHFNFQIKKYAKIMEFFHHFPGIVPGVCVYPLSQIKTQVQYFFHWLSLNYNPHFLHHHLFISIFSFCYDDNNNNTGAVER